MKLLIFGRGLYLLNMRRLKGVGVLKFVGELMGVVCGEVLMKGGKASLSIFPLLWVTVSRFVSGMIDGVGVDPLKILYPELYVSSTDKETCIFDVVSHQEGDDVRFWNLRFYRDFELWELAASFSLLDFI